MMPTFGAYVAEPAGTPKAAIIVIQEIFGVNPGIRQKCDKPRRRWLFSRWHPICSGRLEPGVGAGPRCRSPNSRPRSI